MILWGEFFDYGVGENMRLVKGELKLTLFDKIKHKIKPDIIERMPENITKFWVCNRCGYHFGSPWFDLRREMKHCTACGSGDIKIFKVMDQT